MTRKLTRAALIDILAEINAEGNLFGTAGQLEYEEECEMYDRQASVASQIATAFALDRPKYNRAVRRHERRILKTEQEQP